MITFSYTDKGGKGMNLVTYKFEEKKLIYMTDYGEKQSIVIVFMPYGPNNIFSLAQVFLIDQMDKIDEEVLNNNVPIIQPYTDWIGPYKINALNNVDIPTDGHQFSGGCHASATGEPTAESIYVDVFINNSIVTKDITNISLTSPLIIVTTNMIEASNTHINHKRYVLEEKVTYSVFNAKVNVELENQFKESCLWIWYSGLQLSGQYYNQSEIKNSAVFGFQDFGRGVSSGPISKFGLADKVTLRNKENRDYLEAKLTKAKYKKVNLDVDDIVNGGAEPYYKFYYTLVNTAFEIGAGEIFSWEGSYTFYKEM
ncbi:hypothetical protein D920_00036 [Enterococcus faecalis 13-SD-W-01]|nr:hypothetical protein D920_00036 [Enterococcus faecalis 13-SD-W-01]